MAGRSAGRGPILWHLSHRYALSISASFPLAPLPFPVRDLLLAGITLNSDDKWEMQVVQGPYTYRVRVVAGGPENSEQGSITSLSLFLDEQQVIKEPV